MVFNALFAQILPSEKIQTELRTGIENNNSNLTKWFEIDVQSVIIAGKYNMFELEGGSLFHVCLQAITD